MVVCAFIAAIVDYEDSLIDEGMEKYLFLLKVWLLLRMETMLILMFLINMLFKSLRYNPYGKSYQK
ncbi:hypothetical protein [Clostridium sp.]|uniref:hypothetical protein n=1 Tax=Clostridium sp. TaxID=1506 RepID=UPI002625F180|nr:hypothetical protein [uncultured Clostridium sp.]